MCSCEIHEVRGCLRFILYPPSLLFYVEFHGHFGSLRGALSTRKVDVARLIRQNQPH